MYVSDRDPHDIPPPPTIDEAAKLFGLPVMSFISQPSLDERKFPSTTGSSWNGGAASLDSVAISYTFWRDPGERKDPWNLMELSESGGEALDADPVKPLPEWMMEQRELMRYPMLWEAVMTTRVAGDGWQTPESTLVGHVNHILMNSFHESRVVGDFPGELDAPVAERHIQAVAIPVDGAEVPGMRIDTDPHVYGVGAALNDRILTAVIAREYLPHIAVAFRTREMPTEP